MNWLEDQVARSWWFTYLFLYIYSLMWISTLIAMSIIEWSWANFLFVFRPLALITWFICVPLAYFFHKWAIVKAKKEGRIQ
jgi:hypothetical protein